MDALRADMRTVLENQEVIERMNQTIVEKFLCILKLAKLPKSFWGEVFNIAVYLINRFPLVPLDFDIPQRVWIEKMFHTLI